jgi:ribose transport system ATP-binding protein
MTPTPLLEMSGIRKVFPGVVALDNVDFDLLPGEVHALVGENGAGKSTLIKIISGVYQRDGGTMLMDGQPVSFKSPADSIAAGIKVVYQELDLVPDMTVAENIFLDKLPHKRAGLIDWNRLYADSSKLLMGLGLTTDPATKVADLRVSEQQLVEIARSLSRQARVIIMDEPTSALSPVEVQKLFGSIQCLKEANVGVIYISHKLEEVYEIADRVTVFRDGNKILTSSVNDTKPQELVNSMVGRELKDYFPKTQAQIGKPLLEVRNITAERLNDLSLTVSTGEVVGVFGLVGAGNHQVGRALFGDIERTGEVLIEGQPIKPNSPVDAIHKGLALLTENRRADGLVPLLGVKANITLASLHRMAKMGWIMRRQETRAAAENVDRLAIKTPSLNQPIRFLSGGNQQKAIMARWLLMHPKVLILSEPTRGIDVGAKAEIYRLIDQMAHEGIGVLVISTEMPEVLGICDRILTMFEGRVTGEFARGEATEERLLAAAAGIATENPKAGTA